MPDSFSDYLRVIAPSLPTQLVSPESLATIANLAPKLPAAGGLFECRLEDQASQVDLSIGLEQPKLIPLFEQTSWRSIRTLFQKWGELENPLHETLKCVGMEFDIDADTSTVPLPALFLRWKPLDENATSEEASTQRQIIETAIDELLDHSIPETVRQNLRLCYDKLPAGGFVSALGVMLSREANVIRLVIALSNPQQILEYLDNIGWTGTEQLAPVLDKLFSLVDLISLAIDVSHTIAPRIGFECFFEKQPPNEPRWRPFLDDLVNSGLCNSAKRDGILSWAGYSYFHDHVAIYPPKLRKAASFNQLHRQSVFVRSVNHIKIVYHPEKGLEAKAYLHFGHRWVNIEKDKLHARTPAPLQRTDSAFG